VQKQKSNITKKRVLQTPTKAKKPYGFGFLGKAGGTHSDGCTKIGVREKGQKIILCAPQKAPNRKKP